MTMSSSDVFEFGRVLRRARRDRDETQLQVALALGVSPSFISMLEKSVLPAKIASIERYAEYLNLDVRPILAEVIPVFHRLGRELDRRVA